MTIPMRIRLAEAMRPIMTRLPRGRHRLYRLLLGAQYSSSRGDAILKQELLDRTRVFRDHFIGAYILADISSSESRSHYFTGLYVDRVVPFLVRKVLQGGGTFVDVGANRGLHTLAAAKSLGDRGRVIAFEPNPSTARALETHLTINGINNCVVHVMGLSDQPGVLPLNMFAGECSSCCSFLNNETVVRSIEVPVRRMDEVLEGTTLHGPLLVKVDTEGFEHKVIQGAGKLLLRDDLVIITEITDQWLRLANSSAEAFFSEMADRGFTAFMPQLSRRRGNEILKMSPMPRVPDMFQFDVVFCRDSELVAEH